MTRPALFGATLQATVLAVTATMTAPPAACQTTLTANTVTLDDPAARPAATIAEAAWIAGHWKGEALGGVVEEVWSAPQGNAIMGMYRLVNDNGVVFYELLTIAEDAGSLILRIKHFNPDLTGWEEKDEVVMFRLVRLTPTEAYFDGFTFRRVGQSELHVFVASRESDGTVNELGFKYQRVK